MKRLALSKIAEADKRIEITSRKNLLVSFSGGRSSAKMAWLIKQHWCKIFKVVFVFANTSKEREETLVFVDRCDREWNLGVVWVEAVTHLGERKGCTHKIVDFSTAKRNGEVFEAMIQKYGIPNMNYLHCTRELKANPIKSFVESLGWENYVIAQGMRADEPKRIKPKVGTIYPLAHTWPTSKPEVIDWWKEQAFDLGLKDHQGNCDGCHKKNILKLVRIAQENERVFDWWGEMEQQYGLSGYNEDGTPRTFYRGRRSASDVVAMSKILILPPLPDEDEDAGCGESCEAFA
jgi:hypothetical protein